jgi:hypothetical protein
MEDMISKVPAPARREAGLFFYPSGPVLSVYVNLPVAVELDESFTGIELRGDTSVFKSLRTSILPGGHLMVGQMPVKITATPRGRSAIYEDTVFQQIKAADITVRIGIGSGSAGAQSKRRFNFKNCKIIRAATPIHGTIIDMYLFKVDTVALNLNAEALDMKEQNASDWDKRPCIQLSGTVCQANFNHLKDIHLAAKNLRAKEVYISKAENALLEIQASEIANLRNLDGCTLRLDGNPPHTRILEQR